MIETYAAIIQKLFGPLKETIEAFRTSRVRADRLAYGYALIQIFLSMNKMIRSGKQVIFALENVINDHSDQGSTQDEASTVNHSIVMFSKAILKQQQNCAQAIKQLLDSHIYIVITDHKLHNELEIWLNAKGGVLRDILGILLYRGYPLSIEFQLPPDGEIGVAPRVKYVAVDKEKDAIGESGDIFIGKRSWRGEKSFLHPEIIKRLSEIDITASKLRIDELSQLTSQLDAIIKKTFSIEEIIDMLKKNY